MYSFAIVAQSDRPGSLFWICHQVRVTGGADGGDVQRAGDAEEGVHLLRCHHDLLASAGHRGTIASKHTHRTCHAGRATVHPKADALGELNLILAADILVALVAALHAYFLILEMFLWDKPLGLKTFRNTPEKAEITKVLAANQGLYNGFLAANILVTIKHITTVMHDQSS